MRIGEDDSSGRANWLQIGSLLVAISAVVVPLWLHFVDRSEFHHRERAEPRALIVTPHDYGYAGSRPRIEVTLHNTGGSLVVIDGARITIRHVYEIPRCATQGDIPLSAEYGVSLPVDARPGQVIDAPLHQQIGADATDRFAITLSPGGVSGKSATVYVFDLSVSLRTDGPQPELPIGRVLISLPHVPYRGEYVWIPGTASLLKRIAGSDPRPAREIWASSMPCWRANTLVLRRALNGREVTSPALERLLTTLVTPSFAALE